MFQGHTEMSGEDIKKAFCAYVLPRIRLEFGAEGQTFRLELTTDDPYDSNGGNLLTTIFYSMTEISNLGVVRAIKKLLEGKVLSSRMSDPLDYWAKHFMTGLGKTEGDPVGRQILCDKRVFQELYSTWIEIPEYFNY